MPPFSIRHIDHIVLRTADARTLLRFYEDVLGCTLERQLDIGLSQLRAGNALIDIVDTTRMPDNSGSRTGSGDSPGVAGLRRNMDHFCLRVDPFEPDTIRAYLADNGVESGEPVEVYGAEGFGISIYLEDPAGNTVELKGPATRPPLTQIPRAT
jgi:catechol 2,3-dioxygenase-like lactoylglutathione lyase family enzyme